MHIACLEVSITCSVYFKLESKNFWEKKEEAIRVEPKITDLSIEILLKNNKIFNLIFKL